MNLIEQLGGYDKAKAEGEEWGFDDFLNNQLLEYRRQHNIFEFGDKVVFNSYELDAGIREIQDYHNGCIGSVFRHATDDEIKVGHRI